MRGNRQAAAVLCVLGMLSPARAADIRINPVRITLSDGEPIASMHIENTGEDTILMQMGVFAWSQQNGADVLVPSQDVLANPPQFRLAGGADQIVRFGLRAKSGVQEQSLRVLIDQVPQAPSGNTSTVQTVFRISVPIFITVPGAKPSLDWTWRGTVLRATNSGTAHAEILKLSVMDSTGATKARIDEPGYVLPGQYHEWKLNPGAVTALHLHAETDQGPLDQAIGKQENGGGGP